MQPTHVQISHATHVVRISTVCLLQNDSKTLADLHWIRKIFGLREPRVFSKYATEHHVLAESAKSLFWTYVLRSVDASPGASNLNNTFAAKMDLISGMTRLVVVEYDIRMLGLNSQILQSRVHRFR